MDPSAGAGGPVVRLDLGVDRGVVRWA